MPTWVFIVWLIIGAVIGFVAPRMMSGQAPGGQLGDYVLGIVGALLGGYGLTLGLNTMQATVGGLIMALVAAVVGGLILVWAARRLTKTA